MLEQNEVVQKDHNSNSEFVGNEQGDLEALLTVLPDEIVDKLNQQKDIEHLLEIVLDLGRLPLARFSQQEIPLSSNEITNQDLSTVVSKIGAFGADNRAGIERTLHRISCLRNREGKIVGLTCRVGRAIFGTIKIVEDLIMSGPSILLLGRPGVGKTTMLREVARVLADDAHRRVVVVDTSNEIAGDGDIPHPAIGKSRRMQVGSPDLQHAVMIEAVENHMPEVIVIDEMGSELEAAAARTIAERGVQLIATAHGNTLNNLVLNPTLSDLVGGIQSVTLGDEEARRRGTRKSILERKAPPTFEVVIEIQGWNEVVVHENVSSKVDALLRGSSIIPQVRWVDDHGNIKFGKGDKVILPTSPDNRNDFFRPISRNNLDFKAKAQNRLEDVEGNTGFEFPPVSDSSNPITTPRLIHLFSYGVNKERLEHTIRYFGIGAGLVPDLERADIILTTKLHYRRKPEFLTTAESRGKSIYVLRKNTQLQIEQFLKSLSLGWRTEGKDKVSGGIEEAETAVEQIFNGGGSVELSPQSAYVRRLQHLLAERYNLASASTGRDPQRRVIFYQP